MLPCPARRFCLASFHLQLRRAVRAKIEKRLAEIAMISYRLYNPKKAPDAQAAEDGDAEVAPKKLVFKFEESGPILEAFALVEMENEYQEV